MINDKCQMFNGIREARDKIPKDKSKIPLTGLIQPDQRRNSKIFFRDAVKLPAIIKGET